MHRRAIPWARNSGHVLGRLVAASEAQTGNKKKREIMYFHSVIRFKMVAWGKIFVPPGRAAASIMIDRFGLSPGPISTWRDATRVLCVGRSPDLRASNAASLMISR